MRVAITQFVTTSNVQENLASCIRVINEAAVCKPSIIVLPEYCNTLFHNAYPGDEFLENNQNGYVDHYQAWNEALSINDFFLQSIAKLAKKHHCYIVINVTLKRELLNEFSTISQEHTIKPAISVTSCLFCPLGKLIHQADKQTLTEHESTYFISANKAAEVVKTSIGALGFLSGYDSMTFALPRHLALQGAQLLCHSMCTSTLDQCNLHNAARACENNLFIASANKMGKSQILSQEGKVLVKINHNKEGIAFIDIALDSNNSEIGFNNKRRPDGTLLAKQRRPELYQALTAEIKQTNQNKADSSDFIAQDTPKTTNAAIFATYKPNEQAIEDVCHYIDNNLSDIIQLPELFFVADKTSTLDATQRIKIETLSKLMITKVSAVLRPFQYVCTSLIINRIHQSVLISERGVIALQPQLHFCQRYQWTTLGNNINIIELPLEQGCIKVAMLTADDANIPELVSLVALKGIHLLLVPFDIQNPNEVEHSLLSRAAEHRICIIAASHEKSFTQAFSDKNNKTKVRKFTGLIANLAKDFSFLPQQSLSSFKITKCNSFINQPLVKYQQGKITKALVYPMATCNKLSLTQITLPLIN